MKKHEQVSMKTASEAVEFLPDALEIQQERLPWYAHVGIAWIALIVFAVLAWSCLSEVDVIVKAQGKVVSDRGNVVMKPRESAVIRNVNVKVGDIVEAGQPLITFDPSVNQAEQERIQREIELLEAQYSRFLAESKQEDYLTASGKANELQAEIYRQRQTYYQERISYYSINAQRLETARKSTEESLAKYQEILQSMTEIEQMYKDLRKENSVSYKELLEVTMNRMQYEAQISQMKHQKLEYDQQLLSLDAERNSFVEEWNNSISEKLFEISRELESDRKQLAKVESLLAYVNLCSPCRAVVLEIANFPVGSAVGEAEAVITLVPLEEDLEIEANVRPQDISKVHVGSETRIKLTAFPFQRYGTLGGNLKMISGNSFAAGQTAPANDSQSFYRVRTTVTGSLRNVGDDFTLIPGMEAEVEIKTGKRRIIEYLIHPLIKGLDEAFREP